MLTSSRLYAKEITFDKSSFIKCTIYQKLRNSNETLLASFLMCYFSYLPWIAASEGLGLTTLFSNKMRRGGNSHKNISIPLPFYQSSVSLPLLSVKTIKNLRSIRKLKHVKHLHGPRALYFPRADARNSQYLVY